MEKFQKPIDLLKNIQDLLNENKSLWTPEEIKTIKKDLSKNSKLTTMEMCKRINGILKNLKEENAEQKLKNVIRFLNIKKK